MTETSLSTGGQNWATLKFPFSSYARGLSGTEENTFFLGFLDNFLEYAYIVNVCSQWEVEMRAEKLCTETRKDQIAQAALGLVASHGAKRLSVAAVARRVGFVPSAIYRHFKGKEEVLDAIPGLIRERLLGNLRAVCEKTSDPLQRLKGLLMLHVRLVRENQGIPRIVFSEDFYGGHPERRARVLGGIREYLDSVGEIVRQGQREGQVRADLDPGTVSLMFLGIIQPAALLWHMSDGQFNVARHVKRAWRIFGEAIRAG